jgi:hypothetical protein
MNLTTVAPGAPSRKRNFPARAAMAEGAYTG